MFDINRVCGIRRCGGVWRGYSGVEAVRFGCVFANVGRSLVCFSFYFSEYAAYLSTNSRKAARYSVTYKDDQIIVF